MQHFYECSEKIDFLKSNLYFQYEFRNIKYGLCIINMIFKRYSLLLFMFYKVVTTSPDPGFPAPHLPTCLKWSSQSSLTRGCIVVNQGCIMGYQGCIGGNQICIGGNQGWIEGNQGYIGSNQGCLGGQRSSIVGQRGYKGGKRVCIEGHWDLIGRNQGCIGNNQGCVGGQRGCKQG